MAKTREYAFVYLFGGIMYGLMEVIWRGHTHWTMTLTGGTALLILYIINIKMSNCNIFFEMPDRCFCNNIAGVYGRRYYKYYIKMECLGLFK